VAQRPAESVAPYTLSLVRSTDVFDHIAEELRTAPMEWLRAWAHSVERREDGTYEVATDAGAVRAGWVFDSVRSLMLYLQTSAFQSGAEGNRTPDFRRAKVSSVF
jgi:hypothetical protein